MPDRDPLLREVRRALLADRFTEGRLTGAKWGPCESDTTLAGRPQCGRQSPPISLATISELTGKVSRAARADSSSARLWAEALVDVRTSSGSASVIRRAVATLERASRIDSMNAELLNDLAVARLELAKHDHDLVSMLRALDVVERALRLNAALEPALFNRALVLERLYLTSAATHAWKDFLRVSPDGAWSGDARVHLARMAANMDTLAPRFYPQRGREQLFRLIGVAAAAITSGDSVVAKATLRRMRAIADSTQRLSADSTVPRVVAWIDRSAASSHLDTTLWKALGAFSDGVASIDTSAYELAEERLGRALGELHRRGSPLVRWSTMLLATALINQGKYDEGDALLRRLLADSAADEPAVTGKALWMRGVIQIRQGNYEGANDFYGHSVRYFARANDARNEAGVPYLLAESFALAGQTRESQDEGYRALRALAPFRASINLHSHIIRLASFAWDLHLRHAALDFVAEAVALNETIHEDDALVLALSTRARDRAALGDTVLALADLDTATLAARRLSGYSALLARATIDLERGRLLRYADPATALGLLTTATDEYRRLDVSVLHSTALYELARVARDVGKRDLARSSLDKALALIESSRQALSSSEARSAYYETVEGVFDTLIELELDAGHPKTAFGYLERERAAIWSSGGDDRATHASAEPLDELTRVLPARRVLVAYAVLPSRLVTWSVSRDGWQVRSQSVARDDIAALVARANEAFEGESGVGDGALSRLHDLLLGPLERDLAGKRELAIVPDRSLVTFPFVALWNRKRGHRLVDDYAVLTLPSVAFALSSAQPGIHGRPTQSALVVGNPKLDDSTAQRLGDLPGSDREARRISELYPSSRILTDTAPRRDAVIDALSHSTVFHFAGHAVLNPDRPERSYLALASDPRAPGRSALEAREIARMRLSNLRIAVLSACSTLASRPSRTGAYVGLADSFLRAGVPATVSTLWDVRDDAIVDLVVMFHRALAEGVAAPEALRRAQVAALASSAPPSDWAAFIYTGP